MKTKITLVLTLVLLAISCTDVPDTDMQPPEFSFEINGDGFSHTFTQDDDFESFQLNLKESMNYEFIFSGSDDDGLKTIIWTFPGSVDLGTTLNFEDEIPLGWRETSRYDSSSYGDGVVFEGDSENPVSRTVLEGKFSIYSGFEDFPYYFDFTAMDYGGMNGDINMSHGRLHISLVNGDQPTELVPRN